MQTVFSYTIIFCLFVWTRPSNAESENFAIAEKLNNFFFFLFQSDKKSEVLLVGVNFKCNGKA